MPCETGLLFCQNKLESCGITVFNFIRILDTAQNHGNVEFSLLFVYASVFDNSLPVKRVFFWVTWHAKLCSYSR